MAKGESAEDGDDEKATDAAEYFLAGRNMSWLIVGASLFGSDVGSSSMVGLAGTGCSSGIAVAAYNWQAPYVLGMLGLVMGPVYRSAGICTTPEFIRKRYDSKVALFVTLIQILFNGIAQLAVTLFSGAIILQTMVGWDVYVSSFCLLGLTMMYVMTGGMKAVAWTDTFQVVIMLTGSVTLTVLAFEAVGGYQSMVEQLEAQGKGWYLQAIRPNEDGFFGDNQYPWLGVSVGVTILGYIYWCMDQTFVQRALISRSTDHLVAGCALASIFKMGLPFIMIWPGMLAMLLYPDKIDPETNSCDSSFVVLVMELLPSGLLGLMVSAMMAALMSSLSSQFNSCSTIFSYDVVMRVRPEISEAKLIWTGRAWQLVMAGCAIAMTPIMMRASSIYIFIQSILGAFNAPVGALFHCGVFHPRANTAGAMASLLIFIPLGLLRCPTLLPQMPSCKCSTPCSTASYQCLTPCSTNSLCICPNPAQPHSLSVVHCRFLTSDIMGLDNHFAKLNFLYFTCFQFFGSYLVIMLVSWQTPHRAPTTEQLDRITYWTQKPEQLPGQSETDTGHADLRGVGVELDGHSKLDGEEMQVNDLVVEERQELQGLEDDNSLQAEVELETNKVKIDESGFKAFMQHFVNLTGDYPWNWYARVSLFALMGIMAVIYAVFSGIFGIAGSGRS